jgi:hypothetical protein
VKPNASEESNYTIDPGVQCIEFIYDNDRMSFKTGIEGGYGF